MAELLYPTPAPHAPPAHAKSGPEGCPCEASVRVRPRRVPNAARRVAGARSWEIASDREGGCRGGKMANPLRPRSREVHWWRRERGWRTVGGGRGNSGPCKPPKQWTVPRPPKPRSTNVGATAACQTGGTVPPSRGVHRVSHRQRRRRRGRTRGMSAEGRSAALAGERRPVDRGPRRHGACRHLWHEEGGLTGTRRVAIEDATAKAAASDRQAVHLTRESGSRLYPSAPIRRGRAAQCCALANAFDVSLAVTLLWLTGLSGPLRVWANNPSS